MKYGKIEDGIVGQCINTGQPLPDFVANKPEILPGLDLFYSAFVELSGDRPVGMGVGAIPWGSAIKYAEVYGFDEVQREALLYHLRKMDTVYLEHTNKVSTGVNSNVRKSSRPRRNA